MSRNVEMYDNEEQVVKRINDLKDQGVLEKDMYIVINSNEQLSIMQSVHNIHIDEVDKYSEVDKKENKGFFGRFMDTIRREDRVTDAFYRMDVSESDRDKYLKQVRDGKILLYVDQNYVHDYEDIASGRCYGGVCNVYGAEGSERMSDVLYKKDERDVKIGEDDDRIDHTVRSKEDRNRSGSPVRDNVEGVDVPAKEEDPYVERRTVDRPISETDDLRDTIGTKKESKDDEIVIPIVEEKVTVTKEPVVVEELVIGKKVKERVEHVEETVKKEKLDVDSEGHVDVDSDLDVDKTKK
jgi:uncharacterized protein (TIGR02271 family)